MGDRDTTHACRQRRLNAVERYFEFKGDPKSKGEQLADSTLAMRRSTYKRALEKPLGKLMLEEITPNRLAALCDDIKAQRGPAVAVHAREIVLMVYRHVQRKGIEVLNPAERVQASAIARFEPRDRALSPSELRLFLAALDQAPTMPTLRLAVRFVLLTGVRKGEFIGATWDEIDFDSETWTIPSRRMKGGRPHIVYLSDQALDILTTLRSCFSASRYLHPGRYDSDLPISDATLNRVIAMAIGRIQTTVPDLLPFTVHDLRRTFSTSLNRHAQRTAKGLENGFTLMVGIAPLEVVDVQADAGVIHEALEEFIHQLGVEGADHRGGKGNVEFEARAAGQIDHHAGEGFIERHVGVAVAGQLRRGTRARDRRPRPARPSRRGPARGAGHLMNL